MTGIPGWHERAACRAADPGLFFERDGETQDARDQRIRHAKTVCGACPVASECLTDAMVTREDYGIRGGRTARERRRDRARAFAGAVRPGAPRPPRTSGPPNRRTPPEVEAMVLLLIRRGHPVKKVATLCQITAQTVYRIIRDDKDAQARQVAS